MLEPSISGSGDIQRLLELAGEEGKASREALYGGIVSFLAEQSAGLTERENTLIREILAKLRREIGASVPAEIAGRLAERDAVSPELLLLLIDDSIEVARSLLTRNVALGDDDLVALIRRGGIAHRLAIAQRDQIGPAITAALVETGDENIVLAMLANDTARIGADTLARLLHAAIGSDGYRAALLGRVDLPPPAARLLYPHVGTAERLQILERHVRNAHDLARLLPEAPEPARDQKSRLQAIAMRKRTGRSADDDAMTMAAAVARLKDGDTAQFEIALAKLTGLKKYIIRRIVMDPDAEPLMFPSRATGLDEAAFATFAQAAARAYRQTSLAQAKIASLVSHYDAVDPMIARQVVQRWSREPVGRARRP